MFCREYEGHSGTRTTFENTTSYTFGPHHKHDADYIYYALDGRIVDQDPSKIPAHASETPAWVLADLMLSRYHGQPLTLAEQRLIDRPFRCASLQWLQQTLTDMSK